MSATKGRTKIRVGNANAEVWKEDGRIHVHWPGACGAVHFSPEELREIVRWLDRPEIDRVHARTTGATSRFVASLRDGRLIVNAENRSGDWAAFKTAFALEGPEYE